MFISYWVMPSLRKKHALKPTDPKINYYIDAVSRSMQVNPENVRKKTRMQRVAYARHMIAFFLYNFTTLSLEEVAFTLGRKDHQTILNSLEVCGKILENDKGYPYYEEFVGLIMELGTTPYIPKKSKLQNQAVFSHLLKPLTNP